MIKKILLWLRTLKGFIFLAVLLTALAVFLGTSLISAYLYEQLLNEQANILMLQLGELELKQTLELTAPQITSQARLTYLGIFVACSVLLLSLTLYLIRLILAPMHNSLIRFNKAVQNLKTGSDLAKFQPEQNNFVFTELNQAFSQATELTRQLGRLLNDRNLLEIKNNLLSKLVIKNNNLNNWNAYIKGIFNDIHLALPFDFLGVYLYENNHHKIRIFWAGPSSQEAKNTAEQLIKFKLNRLNLEEINLRHIELNGVMAKNFTPRVELFVQHLEDTPQVGKVQGVFLHANAMQDLALRLNINSILVVLLNLLGASKAISGYTKQLEKSIHKSELENAMAADVLYGHLLVKNTDQIHGIEHKITSSCRFSGDVIQVKRAPSGNIFVLLADATGHGLSATITIMPVITIFNAMVQKDYSIQDILHDINKTLVHHLPDDRFVAAQLVEIDPSKLSLKLWNGGMPAAFLLNSHGQMLKKFKSQHMALGILDEGMFDNSVIQLDFKPTDSLLLYSDGLIEQENNNSEPFGIYNLLEYLEKQQNQLNLNNLINEVLNFAKVKQPDDDIAICKLNLSSLIKHTISVRQAS